MEFPQSQKFQGVQERMAKFIEPKYHHVAEEETEGQR